jgi:hypothetical protein
MSNTEAETVSVIARGGTPSRNMLAIIAMVERYGVLLVPAEHVQFLLPEMRKTMRHGMERIFRNCRPSLLNDEMAAFEEDVKAGNVFAVVLYQDGYIKFLGVVVVKPNDTTHVQNPCGMCPNEVGYLHYIVLHPQVQGARLGSLMTWLGMMAVSFLSTSICGYALTVQCREMSGGRHALPSEQLPYLLYLYIMTMRFCTRAHQTSGGGDPATYFLESVPDYVEKTLEPRWEKVHEAAAFLHPYKCEREVVDRAVNLRSMGFVLVPAYRLCSCSQTPVASCNAETRQSARVAAGGVGGCSARRTEMPPAGGFNGPLASAAAARAATPPPQDEKSHSPTPRLPTDDPAVGAVHPAVGQKGAWSLEVGNKNMLFGGVVTDVDEEHKEYYVCFDDGDEACYDVEGGDHPLDAVIKNGLQFDHVCKSTAEQRGDDHGKAYKEFHGLLPKKAKSARHEPYARARKGKGASCAECSRRHRPCTGKKPWCQGRQHNRPAFKRCDACRKSKQKCGENPHCERV